MVSHFSQYSFLVEGILVIVFESSPCNSVHSSATVHVLIGVDMFSELIILHYSVLYTACRTKKESNYTYFNGNCQVLMNYIVSTCIYLIMIYGIIIFECLKMLLFCLNMFFNFQFVTFP